MLLPLLLKAAVGRGHRFGGGRGVEWGMMMEGREETGNQTGKGSQKRTFGRECGGGRIVASCHGCGVWLPVVCVAWVGGWCVRKSACSSEKHSVFGSSLERFPGTF